jgi:DNA-binding NarL/FixJ family response regulator
MSAPEVDGIRVLLADDHTLFRESLRALLDAHGDVVVIGEAGDGASAVELVARLQPDVVLLDVEMPGQSVLTTLPEIRQAAPDCRVLILTMHETTVLVRQLVLRGASGYLVKTIGHEELVAAIKSAVAAGAGLATMSVTRESLLSLAGGPAARILSDRELEILQCVRRAQSNLQIARELGISEGTVKRHLSNINGKLGATSRIDAVRKAMSANLLSGSFNV